MAKNTPAKKSAKPVKKAPLKAPAKALKPIATAKKKSMPIAAKPKPATKSQAVAKAVQEKKISKPAVKTAVKPVAKKPAQKTTVKSLIKGASKPAVKTPVNATKTVNSKVPPAKKISSSPDRVLAQQFVRKPKANNQAHMTPFLVRQRQRLLELKDTLLDSMRGVARDNLHAGSETSAFGMHQADAGSDAYDRDFALSMLSKEQGSLYEIDEALKRIDDGSYGVCDICEKPIRHDRLEALPFTRYTVECQAELEKRQHHHSVRPHINSLFGLTEEEAESEEEDTVESS